MLQTPPQEIHWHKTAVSAPESHELDGSVQVDVLVIGGGLTGCRTALGLADAGVSVAIADSRDIGWGASGRSGGQCNPLWRKTPDELRAHLGSAQADRLIRTTIASADDLFNDIRSYDVDCDGVQNGWVQAAHTGKAHKRMQLMGKAWSAEGSEITVLEDRDAVQHASGSPAYGFGLLHAKGGHVHPLSLTRGYAKTAAERGARIFKNCEITALTRAEGKWQAATSKGNITAENVVLATNAYSTGLWPNLRKSYMPLVSISFATQPLTTEQQETVLPNKVTIADTRLAIFYSRYDRDGRLIFGCVGSNEDVGTFGGHRRLRTGLRTVFPQIADIPFESTWMGRIAVTPDMMPNMHEPAPGVLAGLGFSGRGIAMTSVMGRALSAKLLGTPEQDLPFPVTPISALPLHGITRSMIPLGAPAMNLKDRLDSLIDPS